jgi:hypothetical protein
MSIQRSTLDNNHASIYGGAIDESGSVTVDRSTMAGNSAGGPFRGGGAAVILAGGAQLSLNNSTVSANITSPPGGAAIYNYGGGATLSYDTFSANSGAVTGGGFTTATGTIFEGTTSVPACLSPVHETVGYNLDNDRSCQLALSTDVAGVDPMLGPLAHNGGPTETQLPMTGSPAIDNGGLPNTSGCPLTDQRGRARPSGPACDIGSVEVRQ